MIQVAYTNIQFKTKINDLLSEPFTFMWLVHQGFPLSTLLYITSAINYILLRYLQFLSLPIRGLVEYRLETMGKILNFADDSTIFLRDITYYTRIQSILKLCGKLSSSKIHFSKIQAL